MTPSHLRFRPEVHDLEDRTVPASSASSAGLIAAETALIAGYNRQEAAAYREVSNIYQTGTQNATARYKAYEAEQNGLAQAVNDYATVLRAQAAAGNQEAQKRIGSIRERFNAAVGQLKAQSDAALNTLPPGAPSQQGGTIIGWTRMQYEQLVTGATQQYNDVMFQLSRLEQGVRAQYAGAVANATAKFAELNKAQAQLLNAYDTFQNDLVGYYTEQVFRLRTELTNQLTALRAAYASQFEIQSQSQLQQQMNSSSSGHISYRR